jgi:hypothetical protein
VELYNVINIILASVGVWRSLVAHFAGGEGVVGSNPITPTNTSPLQIPQDTLSSIKSRAKAPKAPQRTLKYFEAGKVFSILGSNTTIRLPIAMLLKCQEQPNN